MVVMMVVVVVMVICDGHTLFLAGHGPTSGTEGTGTSAAAGAGALPLASLGLMVWGLGFGV